MCNGEAFPNGELTRYLLLIIQLIISKVATVKMIFDQIKTDFNKYSFKTQILYFGNHSHNEHNIEGSLIFLIITKESSLFLCRVCVEEKRKRIVRTQCCRIKAERLRRAFKVNETNELKKVKRRRVVDLNGLFINCWSQRFVRLIESKWSSERLLMSHHVYRIAKNISIGCKRNTAKFAKNE